MYDSSCQQVEKMYSGALAKTYKEGRVPLPQRVTKVPLVYLMLKQM